MAFNPELFPDGMPVPFLGERFVSFRDGVKFEVDKFPGVKARGRIYLTNIRLVFTGTSATNGRPFAYDMPLVYIHGEHFPDYYRCTIYGHVEPVILPELDWPVDSTQTFEMEFEKGGCHTFFCLFINVINSARSGSLHYNSTPEKHHLRFTPLITENPNRKPVNEIIREACIDREDPTTIFFEQPIPWSSFKRYQY